MGTLYVCATPIGNLEDASYRLVRILGEVDLIACEDTRHTRILLNHYGIKGAAISYHQHNQKEREEQLISRLLAGDNIALVSDAGTPGISDPGRLLISMAREGIRVEIIPGPSAFVAALVLSGLDSQAFVFEGFLPARSAQRRKHLERLKGEMRTLVFYESPHRLLALLKDINELWGDRQVAVARELTKIYEEVKGGLVSEVIKHYEEHPPRGEISIVVEGARPDIPPDLEQVCHEVLDLMGKGVEKKQALAQKAREYGMKKSEIYNRIEQLLGS